MLRRDSPAVTGRASGGTDTASHDKGTSPGRRLGDAKDNGEGDADERLERRLLFCFPV